MTASALPGPGRYSIYTGRVTNWPLAAALSTALIAPLLLLGGLSHGSWLGPAGPAIPLLLAAAAVLTTVLTGLSEGDGGAQRGLGPLRGARMATPHLPPGRDRARRGDRSATVAVAVVPRLLVDPSPHLLHGPDRTRPAASPAHRPEREDHRTRPPRRGHDHPRGEGRLTL
jgi:hypothetical protein